MATFCLLLCPQSSTVGVQSFSKVYVKSPGWPTSKDCVPGEEKEIRGRYERREWWCELDRSNFNSRDPPHHVVVMPCCDPRHMLFLTRSPCLRSASVPRRVSLPSTYPRFLATMPPKTKRKATEEDSPPKKRVKKSDTMNSQVSLASKAASEIDPSGQPTNTTLPDEISFPERAPGARRISAWNVCGWAASNKKVGSLTFLDICGDSFMTKLGVWPIYRSGGC